MIPSSLLESFREAMEKSAAMTEKQEDLHRRRRFKRLHKSLMSEGAETGATMKRIIVNKKHLTEEDIKKLHFKPVAIAVPEAGQTSIRSFRHPISNHHIHEHGDSWVMHHDSKPSTTMLWEKDRLRREGKLKDIIAPHKLPGEKSKKKTKAAPPSRFDLVKSTAQGMPHLIGEGVPGMAAYLRGRITRSEGMKHRVVKGLNPRLLKRMNRWAESPSYRRAMHSMNTGASSVAHTPASPATTGGP